MYAGTVLNAVRHWFVQAALFRLPRRRALHQLVPYIADQLTTVAPYVMRPTLLPAETTSNLRGGS